MCPKCFLFPLFPSYENENGNENPCGVDEKRMKTMMHCWNHQYFDAGAGVVSSNGGGTVNQINIYLKNETKGII